MQYAFLIYTTESLHESMTPEQGVAAVNNNLAVVNAAASRGVFEASVRLEPPQHSITARRDGAGSSFTDGPFAETKEILGGFYLIDCENEEEAREWARRLNQTGCSTAVEFRPVAHAITRADVLAASTHA